MAKKKTENVKILHLPLKAKWYEMIESGVKTEEYREIKSYWRNRIGCQGNGICSKDKPCLAIRSRNGVCERYTHVCFRYGYTKRTMTYEIESITIGKGKPEWGAPTEDVFIIKLGKRL